MKSSEIILCVVQQPFASSFCPPMSHKGLVDELCFIFAIYFCRSYSTMFNFFLFSFFSPATLCKRRVQDFFFFSLILIIFYEQRF